MVCTKCFDMLHRNKGLAMHGSLRQTFDHHMSTTTLRQSADVGCSICMTLAKHLEPTMRLTEDNPITLRALLQKIPVEPGKRVRFSLEFTLERVFKCTFILTETSTKHPSRSGGSSSTSSDGVLHVAQRWINACRCADAWKEPGKKWYPRRLLDLEELRCTNGNKDRAKVRLVESSDLMREKTMLGSTPVYKHANYRYVTLSHCWGKPREGYTPLTLTDLTMARFMNDGIELEEFPNTFRHALLFAHKLDQVRFL
ncbi:hypothetical protein CC86DRAFT_463330 [Ophiobolus disseminans]|uniref:Heterokaryon incompatibility domain-containing protein n=1 Tax=Ophiobolus disseminans TaxID=1469910 RepID=A0A6A7ADW1_9PLEO|nr:hypothetical protein CC86DRAFT_463330 [Ophiobolus disseminans]